MGLRNHSSKKNSIEGFTLLELLVVLSIIGLLSMVVLVSLPGSRDTLNLKLSARDVMAQMTESRNQAIRTRREVRFFLDLSQKEYWVEDLGDRRRLADDMELEIYTAKGEQGANNVAAIRFFPDGSSTGGYIRISREGSNYRIAVNWLTGKIVMDHEKKQE